MLPGGVFELVQMPGQGPWSFKVILTDGSYVSALSVPLKSALVCLSWSFKVILTDGSYVRGPSNP
jgi:hypothetical protein